MFIQWLLFKKEESKPVVLLSREIFVILIHCTGPEELKFKKLVKNIDYPKRDW